jgi:ABC-type Fe3+/spermidine/putrescine transport system ATPase subunit
MSDHIAVMKSGKFLQIGTPVDIHDHPGTRFVADFMGATNILTGKVVEKSSSGAAIITEGGLTVIAPDNDQSVNDSNSISISPEAIEIRPAKAEWKIDNKFPAKIEENVYLGDVSEIIIALNQTETIKAKLTRHSRLNSGDLKVGDEIQVGWRKEDINSLAD